MEKYCQKLAVLDLQIENEALTEFNSIKTRFLVRLIFIVSGFSIDEFVCCLYRSIRPTTS